MTSDQTNPLDLLSQLVELIAQRTADRLMERMQPGNKPQQSEGRWGTVATAAKRMGLKTERALRERKRSGGVPAHFSRKFGGSVMWDLAAFDEYMASLPSE